GKTALVKYLENEGYPVMHEISRQVILEAQQDGIEQLFLENPILFSQKLLEGRLKQFHESKNCAAPLLFFDRGMPDVTAYMDFVEVHYPKKFSETSLVLRYKEIFFLQYCHAIYHHDI